MLRSKSLGSTITIASWTTSVRLYPATGCGYNGQRGSSARSGAYGGQRGSDKRLDGAGADRPHANPRLAVTAGQRATARGLQPAARSISRVERCGRNDHRHEVQYALRAAGSTWGAWTALKNGNGDRGTTDTRGMMLASGEIPCAREEQEPASGWKKQQHADRRRIPARKRSLEAGYSVPAGEQELEAGGGRVPA